MRIEVNANERDAHNLAGGTLKAAIEAIEVDGYVVLGGVIGFAALDGMRAKLADDTAELLRRIDRDHASHFSGHLSQPMPTSHEFIYSEVVTNPLVIQVTAAMLGAGVHNHFYNCNTNLPGSARQALHRDAPHLGRDPIHPTTSIVVNVCPIDVDELNGATELWPGTHRIEGGTGVTADAEAARRALTPPVRAVTVKGDVVLRDPRLWHRGMPNTTAEPRHMVAMVHSIWCYMHEVAIPVTRGALHSFDDNVLRTGVALVPDEYDYLGVTY